MPRYCKINRDELKTGMEEISVYDTLSGGDLLQVFVCVCVWLFCVSR